MRAALRREALAVDEERDLGEDTLVWSCDAEGNLALDGALPQGDLVLAACWDGEGRFTGARLLDADTTQAKLADGWTQVKLLWLNSTMAPRCAAARF